MLMATNPTEKAKVATEDPRSKPGYVAAEDMKHPGYGPTPEEIKAKAESTKISLAQISSQGEVQSEAAASGPALYSAEW